MLCTSGFVNDVMFSHNAANRLVLSSLPGGGTGEKSAVSDCIVFSTYEYFYEI